MSTRSAILTTATTLVGLGIATTASASAAAAPAPTLAPTPSAAYVVAGTLSPASFQESLNRAYFEAKAAGITAEATTATPAVSDEVAAWASSPKSMAVKFCESTNNYSINTEIGRAHV